MDLNKIQLIGHLAADPETGVTKGVPIAVFRMATNRVWKDAKAGTVKHDVDWHRVITFGRLAEVVAKYVKKGDRLYVDGSLRTMERALPDGGRSVKIGIIAKNIIMLGGAKKEPTNDDVVEEEIDDGAGD